MPAHAAFFRSLPLAFTALICSLGFRADTLPHPQSRIAALPRITLWAWERREDLHAITSKAAFELLHKRYPKSPWTAKTPYYY